MKPAFILPFALLTSASSLFAQVTASAPEPTPGLALAPETDAQKAAPAPVAAINPIDLAKTKITETINEPKLNGNALAGLYRKYTGRRVIVTAAAAQVEFSFIQEATANDSLSYEKAAELLKKAATIENFIFVPDASDPNLDILTQAAAGIKPTARGVKVYDENDPLPSGDAVISYIMRFKHIKPDDAQKIFTQIIGQLGAYGSMAIASNTGSLIITENTSLIRKLIDIKNEIDKPTLVSTRFVNVQYADVTELSELINDLIKNEQAAKSGTAVRVNNAAPQGVNAAQVGGDSSGEEIPPKVIPDPRTNRIFVQGRSVDIMFIENLIRQFDIRTDSKNFLRRKLHFLKVGDFLNIAENAINRAFSSGNESSGGAEGAGSKKSNPNAQAGNSNPNNSRNSNLGGGNSYYGGGNKNSGGGGGGLSTSLQADNDTAPEARLIGRTLLVADKITNSVIVQGPPASQEIINNLLNQLDVKADQVMISTVFGQLDLKEGLTTGVDWLHIFQGNSSKGIAGSLIGGASALVNPSNINQPNINSTSVTNGFPAGGGSGLSLYGKVGSNLTSYISMLETDNNFTILSRPSIFTANNQLGVISSGSRIAVPTNSSSYNGGSVGNNGTTNTNIEYRDVVLKLAVVPLINSEEDVTLKIELLNDEVINTQTIDGVGDVPIIGTRELTSTVSIKNNQTLVLGGLVTTKESVSNSGVPVIKNIPYLGRLFSTDKKEKNRSELMVFIQPTIVSGDDSLDHTQRDMDKRYKVSKKGRQFSQDGDLEHNLEPAQEIYEPIRAKNSK